MSPTGLEQVGLHQMVQTRQALGVQQASPLPQQRPSKNAQHTQTMYNGKYIEIFLDLYMSVYRRNNLTNYLARMMKCERLKCHQRI